MEDSRVSKRKDSIELYKPWVAKKATEWGYVSQKLDGVPVRIYNVGGMTLPFSRQWEKVHTIPQILAYAKQLVDPGGSLIGELYVDGLPFKDISGLVRRDKPDADTEQLVLWVHDADVKNEPDVQYSWRMVEVIKRLAGLRDRFGMAEEQFPIRVIPGVRCATAEAAIAAFDAIMVANPKAEGAMWHDLRKPFSPGDRKWTGMKMLRKPTIDLLIVGFEEAIDKFGNPKGMVGRVLADMTTIDSAGNMKCRRIGVGPGALKHSERKVLWVKYINGEFKPCVAQVQYKVDDAYESLREPIFQHWRPDKDEPDVRKLTVA